MRFPWKAFCNKAVAICTIFTGKKFPHISQGMKKQIFQNFRKLCAIMSFFGNYANYELRAELCTFASTHNSSSPV